MASSEGQSPDLVRGLGVWDAALVTVGSVLGTGIFITTGDIAKVLPHAGLILVVWILGGLLTLAGAFTYAELGAMFPKAGGQYHYLKEAYGPLWGFLFAWACLLVIMTGGIATLSVGFGEYLGAFVPFFSTGHELIAVPLGTRAFRVNGGQVAGALCIAFLTAINYVGLRMGAGLQNAVTLVKIAAIVALVVFGLLVPAPVSTDLVAPLPDGRLLAALGVGMIAVLWSYDGWYGVTSLAGEMRNPERDIGRGLVAGTVVVTLLYVALNLVYLRALPLATMAGTGRIGEAAATALFGSWGGRLITAAVLVSTFGCLSATILYAARYYLPVAQDGLFFRSMGRIHPRFLTPSTCLVVQGAWSILQAFTGTYEQLYTYVIFAMFLFHAATGAAVIVLRQTRPDVPRPYRVWGYPVVPAVVVLTSLAFVINTVVEKPTESLAGLLLVSLGMPAYFFWRRSAAAR